MISQAKIVIATQIKQAASIKSQPGSGILSEGSDLAKKLTALDIVQASLHQGVCGQIHQNTFLPN
jgi:hypothetical protein